MVQVNNRGVKLLVQSELFGQIHSLSILGNMAVFQFGGRQNIPYDSEFK